MSIVAAVADGSLVDTTKATEAARTAIGDSGATVTTNTTFDKEMFLKLLAAEMQYQDPLEPTDNSEYVSEMAAFSQVEATNNVSDTVSQMSANSMIGQYVTISHDGESITGVVDYTTVNSGEYYVSVNDKTYPASEVVKVQDATYYEAGLAASTLSSMIAKLPSADNLGTTDEEDLNNAVTLYNSLSDYTKSFLSSSDVTKLNSLITRMAAINGTT